MLNEKLYLFPSYTFYPIHHTGKQYIGHGKVYSFEKWGSTSNSYNNFNEITISDNLKEPINSVSILIPSYNTNINYIYDCLTSIKNQLCHIKFEIIWINDGSDEKHTNSLKILLDDFKKAIRFIDIKYIENESNMGLGYSLNRGVLECNNDLIFRMDSDDIMKPMRIEEQFNFMRDNPDIVLCGTQFESFNTYTGKINSRSNHPSLTLDDFNKNKPKWFLNHPTICFRKNAILSVGNYNKDIKVLYEDYDLYVRVLNKYKYVHNLPHSLLYYRNHSEQVTKKKNFIEKNLIKNGSKSL